MHELSQNQIFLAPKILLWNLSNQLLPQEHPWAEDPGRDLLEQACQKHLVSLKSEQVNSSRVRLKQDTLGN